MSDELLSKEKQLELFSEMMLIEASRFELVKELDSFENEIKPISIREPNIQLYNGIEIVAEHYGEKIFKEYLESISMYKLSLKIKTKNDILINVFQLEENI